MKGWYDACTDLTHEDRGQLERIVEALPLVADVYHADLLLWARAGEDATVVFHAAPQPVPSLYPTSQTGHVHSRREGGAIFRVLHEGRGRQSISGTLVWGAPTLQEVFSICSSDGRTAAAVSSNANLIEHERLQERGHLFRSIVARIREQGFTGRLHGAAGLGRLTEHDGVLIVDKHGIIRYMSAVAENQYRRLGYVDNLVGEQISELETNEYICFRSMERAVCLEQRIQEEDQLWIKRAIPLFPAELPGLLGRFRRAGGEPEGALVFIQDITEEVRREQELKIKSALIQEVHHRVKNNLQTLALLLRMEAQRAKSASLRETLRQTIGRVLSIAVVHEFLSQGETADISIREVCSRIAAEVSGGVVGPQKRVQVVVEGDNFALPAQQATSCALSVNELALNAVEHAFPDRNRGSISIRLLRTDASMVIEIADDGVGLPPGFDPNTSPSMGLQIVQTLVRDDLRGQLEFLNGPGVTARISFPKELCEGWDPAGAKPWPHAS